MSEFLLAIDQGTTSSRAIIFDRRGALQSQHQIDLKQTFPSTGWVEQDPEEMWQNTVTCCREVLRKSQISAKEIAGVGIANQRETTLIWDRKTGNPIAPAIVWQDRRTAALCLELAKLPIASRIPEKTGLLLDPYFSATKIMWLLEHIKGAREQAEKGAYAFGTVDTFLLWRLTNGRSHLTDATNASRTLLFNIHTQQWDTEILAAFNIPDKILPRVCDNSDDFGTMDVSILGTSLPIAGMAGDQQAATVGQACFKRGMIKSTYGTGCFMLLNTGETCIQSQNQMLSTIAYRIKDRVTYGLEGSIFNAGTTVKWLRDHLKLIKTAAETEVRAKSVSDNGGVYFVPAFTGLGAPYWDPNARGALLGLTRDSSSEHIIRAALEAVAYQSRDLLQAMQTDSHIDIDILRVDGGMTENNWLLQFLADILDLTVDRPQCIETSALGAAYLAGLQLGTYRSLDEIASLCQHSCNGIFPISI